MSCGFRSKFFYYYATRVLPKIGDMEKLRQKEYKKLIILESIIIIVTLYFLSIVLMNFFPHTFGSRPFIQRAEWEIWLAFFAPIFAVALIAIAFAIPSSMDKKFRNKVKESCIFDLVGAFDNISWSPVSIPSSGSNIEGSELFQYSECKFDDCFEGTYKGVNFSAAETSLIKEVHTKNGTQKVIVFKGIILSFPFSKKINAHTIIKPNTQVCDTVANVLAVLMILSVLALFVFIPGLWKELWADKGVDIIFQGAIYLIGIIAAIIGAKKFKKVKLEDVVFDKDYKVQSEDQIEARYLLTPSFMERFKNLKKAYNSKDIRCAFFDGQILFAISTKKDLFEIGSLYYPLTDSKSVNAFYDEISAIFDIIEEFKLNENTGL